MNHGHMGWGSRREAIFESMLETTLGLLLATLFDSLRSVRRLYSWGVPPVPIRINFQSPSMKAIRRTPLR